MRIAYLSSAIIPSRTANSVHVMNMCHGFAELGHDVVLFATQGSSETLNSCTSVYAQYGVGCNFRIVTLPWESFCFGSLYYRWRIAWSSFVGNFDLIIGRGLAACAFACGLGIPTVYETHAPIPKKSVLGHHLFHLLLRSASFKGLVLITQSLKTKFLQDYPDLQSHIQVLPDGANPIPSFVTPKGLETRHDRMQIGYAGSDLKGKGVDLIIDLAIRCPEFDFHLVGVFEMTVRKRFSDIELPPNLYFYGFRPHGEIRRFLLAFDVLLLPNQISVFMYGGHIDIGKWTSPLKLFEYMAAGKAIVCSDVPVLQEIADNGKNMLVCRHDEPKEWVRALHRLRSNPAFRIQLGQKAREQLEKNFSWNKRCSQILENLNLSTG